MSASYKVLDHETLAKKEFIPYASQWLDEDDVRRVTDVLRGKWITQGPAIQEFESHVARYCGAKYAVAVATGTAALHCAAFAAGVGKEDEVITTPLTFAASANCVTYLGGAVRFADINPETLSIDPPEIRKQITLRTKAVIPVDFAGHPAEMDEIMSLAKEKGLIVITDAAHSLGATYRGKRVGSLADMTILSFHPVKHITTGEGGMILTDNKDFYEKALLFRSHGITNNKALLLNKDEGDWYYEMQALGYNYRITDLQCALGMSQLSKLDGFVARRREIVDFYNRSFSDIEEIVTPTELSHVSSSYHLYVLRFKLDRLRISRRQIFDKLRACGIGVHVHYIPVHLQPYYRQHYGYKRGDYPHAESYYENCLTIPLFPRMSQQDMDRVVASVREIILTHRV